MMEYRERLVIIILLIISYVLISSNIGGVSIYILDEAKNAGCAREMLEKRDFIVPTFNHEIRTDKPPLHYYFMMLGYRLFGVNAFGARFFSAFFGCLTVLITYLFARKTVGLKAAILSVIVLWSSFHYVLQFHLAVPDPYLIFFINAALFSFYLYWSGKKTVYIMIFYISLALGTMAKGPVAIGLPGLIILVFLIITKSLHWNFIGKYKLIPGTLIYLSVTLPWYIMAHLRTQGEWTRGFFLRHNIERFTSTMEGHGGEFYYPILFFLIGLMPFVIFFIQTFKFTIRIEKGPFSLYLIIIIAAFIGFFAFSKTQLPNYIVPMYPAFAILTGTYLNRLIQKDPEAETKTLLISLWVYVIFVLLIPPLVYFGLKLENPLAHLTHLWAYFLLLPAGAVAGIVFLSMRKIKYMIFSLAGSWMITSLMFFFHVFPEINQENPVEKAAKIIDRESPVARYKRMNAAFSFYFQKEIPGLDSEEDIIKFFQKNPKGYIISSKKNYLENMKFFNNNGIMIILEQKDLFENPVTIILAQP